jgi:hypothetical protein
VRSRRTHWSPGTYRGELSAPRSGATGRGIPSRAPSHHPGAQAHGGSSPNSYPLRHSTARVRGPSHHRERGLPVSTPPHHPGDPGTRRCLGGACSSCASADGGELLPVAGRAHLQGAAAVDGAHRIWRSAMETRKFLANAIFVVSWCLDSSVDVVLR